MFTLELCRWEDNEADLRAVRTTVFIDEQAIPEHEEWDEMDAVSVHLIARLDGRAVSLEFAERARAVCLACASPLCPAALLAPRARRGGLGQESGAA